MRAPPALQSFRDALPAHAELLYLCRTPRLSDPSANPFIAICRLPDQSRLETTLVPSSGGKKHSAVATTLSTADGTRFDVSEATMFAAQVLRGHPLYSALVLEGEAEKILFEHTVLNRCVLREEVIGAPFVKSAVHQAAGLARGLLEGSMPCASARWEQVVALLEAAQDRMGLGRGERLRDLDCADAEGWKAECERFCALARAAELAAPASARERALSALEVWLAALPLPEGAPLPPPPADAPAPSAALEELIDALGTPKPPRQIISAVRCGSSMYGLALPTSDADFHLVYLAPPAEMLSLRDAVELRRLHFSRAVGAPYGAAKDGLLEYSAVELSHYLQTLTKGNPSALEPLFVPEEHATHRGWPFDELVAMREAFLTDVAFRQYLGFIRVHISRARSYLTPPPPAEGLDDGDRSGGAAATAPPPLAPDVERAVSKALYHTYHKLFECRRLLRGEALHVRLRGDEHAHVWRIRTASPLVGELAPDALIARAEEMLAALKAERAERGAPPRAPLDVARLHEWLHSVRLRSLARDVAASSPPPPPDPSLGGAPPPAVSRTASAASAASAA